MTKDEALFGKWQTWQEKPEARKLETALIAFREGMCEFDWVWQLVGKLAAACVAEALADPPPGGERVLSPAGVLHDLLAVKGSWAWIRVAEDNGSNHPYTVRLGELTRVVSKGEAHGK